MSQDKVEYWFNITTGEIEQGAQSGWTHRMGPYETYAEAAKALEAARERTESWDAADKSWREDWDGDGAQDFKTRGRIANDTGEGGGGSW